MPQDNFFDQLYATPEPQRSTLTHAQALVEQIILDTEAAKDPLASESDRAFFYERIALYRAECLRLQHAG